MNNTVNHMKRELYVLIINELNRQARPSCKASGREEKERCMRAYVQRQYLKIGGPLNMELLPYFHPDFPDNEHESLVNADLEVLVTIASKLGYSLDMNWTRR
uniref:Uncharacterized protein n=1 Tax=Pseudomonas phage HRDY3 TaxID=3236930 RepID=A0AB39CED2_9VIRU